MRELSLFSGAGGGLLGTLLLGWRPVGYVEVNTYCQRVIAARIKDGILPEAPIFGDIRAFIREGYAKSYQGMVDVITAGFPCQPFSTAGKQLGALDERNMWPATIECLRVVRPQYALLENVPALLTSGYFGTILSDLAQSGYDARWRVLSAAEVGAPHKRDRVWIVAHANGGKCGRGRVQSKRQTGREKDTNANEGRRSHAAHVELGEGTLPGGADFAGLSRQVVWQGGSPVEPAVQRVAHGVAAWVDRLEAIGNGQVPAVVRAAWVLLS